MARQKEKLKLGDGAVFDPTRLKELPQENETWEVDFEALPKPPTQKERHFLGMVVSKKGRCILAEMQVSRPSINDMATMLANSMSSPLSGDAHRPSRIYARYYPPWDDVYPHLKEIGIKVSAHREFPWIYHLFHERLRQMRQMRSPGKVEPTEEQAKVAEMFPALSKFVQDCGFIEIGDPDGCGFVVRAEDYDCVRVFEDDNLSTLVEAMPSKTPDGSRPAPTARRSCTQRCHPAICVRERLCFTESRRSSSARTAPFGGRKIMSGQEASWLRSLTTRSACG